MRADLVYVLAKASAGKGISRKRGEIFTGKMLSICQNEISCEPVGFDPIAAKSGDSVTVALIFHSILSPIASLATVGACETLELSDAQSHNLHS